ncbi:GTPase Era [Hibiscus syriacus]|uniref:GTPase Era n=2 Tax=Hibiscus syriacus TaxID=106335 RepID=A0A6A2Y2U3_HIBSY|nr:GTPase Era [Hibiscus syriacus]
MPTFSAIALDRLLEPGTSESVDKSGPNMKPPLPKPKLITNLKLESRKSASVTERKVNHPQISLPALYATPETTPLPDSPSSFSPSPYIINHKRRGPRLLKSFSENNVSTRKKTTEESEVNGKAELIETMSVDLSKDVSISFSIHKPDEEEHENGVNNGPIKVEQANGFHASSIQDNHMNGVHYGEFGSSNIAVGSRRMNNGMASDFASPKLVSLNLNRGDESEDFFDPMDSMSATTNTNGDDESAVRLGTSGVEFFDAWDELSSESGTQPSYRDTEAEVREIRLSLFMEIEKRKQAEEALNKLRCVWKRMSQELAIVGLLLPADPIDVTDDDLVKQAEEMRQQADIARFVSLCVGRGIARAELETEMEAKIESKNFEIARLWDKLHYYEAVNQEMSQRNQEAIEMARRERQRRKRKQRWVWGSIATAITLGTAALAWSYLPSGKGSSPGDVPQASDPAADVAN